MKKDARIPVVTLILIAANILAAFGVLGLPDLISKLGFHPNAPTFASAVTSLFLHANTVHLLGNMIFLAAVGAAVELASGSLRFACVYFISGLVGVGAHYFMTRTATDPAPYVGASGCIAGCAGYYSFRYPGLKVSLWPGREVSIALVTTLWVILQLAGAFVHFGDTGGISFWSHLGGFAAGIVLSLMFRAPDLGQTQMGHALIDKMSDRGPGAVIATASRHLRTQPNDMKALEDIAHAHAELGEIAEETSTLLRLIEIAPQNRLGEFASRLVASGNAKSLSVWKRTVLAERLRELNPEVAATLLETVIGDSDASQRPEAILSLAQLLLERKPDRFAELIGILVNEYPMDAATDVARKRGWVN